MVMKIPDVVF